MTGCTRKNVFEIEKFSPVSNYQSEKTNNKSIELDYTDAYANGFSVPTIRQVKDSLFTFEFSIKNNSSKQQKFFYKIYYQNESYKFSECIKNDSERVFENPLSSENFYGSWEDASQTFIATEEIPANKDFFKVSGKIRIVGNPRNEKKYYGSDRIVEKIIDKKEIVSKIKEITGNPEWMAGIKSKAAINKITFEKQMELDANYALSQEEDGVVNNRWKRNPRVGYYSFLLVITTEENLTKGLIPDYIQNIGQQYSNTFVNPYYFFLYGNGRNLRNTYIHKADSVLKITARPNLANGIFVKKNDEKLTKLDSSNYRTDCNQSKTLKKNAHFQQFLHNVAATTRIQNIPLIYDVSEYSKNDYAVSQKKYEKSRKDIAVSTSDCPCKTIKYSNDDKALLIKNPGNTKNQYRKENVGIITRHGLCYGKYRVKAKLSKLLNKYNVWNGITNAVWLITENLDPWNGRRICKREGYIPNYDTVKTSRKPCTSYSEIDFEILKAAHFWPKASYPFPLKKPEELTSDSSNIVVTCTNWDMACPEPLKYEAGVQLLKYQDQTFNLHRWDYWNKAITMKQSFSNMELFGSDYYWFEIEWKPEEIIWRIGSEKDKMKVVGYVNSTVSNIPNNQMLFIITQEYHITKWWPDAPFNQEDIPFPLKDIVGKIYEIEIE